MDFHRNTFSQAVNRVYMVHLNIHMYIMVYGH